MASKQRLVLLVALPLMAAADMLSPLFVLASGVTTAHLKLAILPALVVVCWSRVRYDAVTAAMLVFLCYLVLVGLLASDYTNSLGRGVFRIAIAFLMYPVAYGVLNRREDLGLFQRSTLTAAAVIVCSIVAAQFFQFGSRAYDSDIFLGGMGAYANLFLAYVILAAPLSYVLLKGTRVAVMSTPVLALAAATVLFSFRRSAIVGLLIGATVLLVLGRNAVVGPRRVAKWGVALAFATVLAFSFYGDDIADLFQRRGVAGIEREIEARYGRVPETLYVWGAFVDGPLQHTLIGTEFFNSRDMLGWGAEKRMIHVDYNVILHGAGGLGLALYTLVFGAIAVRFRRASRRLPRSPHTRVLVAVFWALMIANVVFSASNQLWVTLPYSLLFLYLGAIQRHVDVIAASREFSIVQPGASVPFGMTALHVAR